jgi:hypothetical protein
MIPAGTNLFQATLTIFSSPSVQHMVHEIDNALLEYKFVISQTAPPT